MVYLKLVPTSDLVALLRSMSQDLAGLRITREDWEAASEPIVNEILRRQMKRCAA